MEPPMNLKQQNLLELSSFFTDAMDVNRNTRRYTCIALSQNIMIIIISNMAERVCVSLWHNINFFVWKLYVIMVTSSV